MTINERTSLLPKDYQKTYIIPIPRDDENNNSSDGNNNDNSVLREYDSCALTKAELNKYIDDPWWIKMRYGCFAFCWIVCLVALAISLYIAADALQHDICGTAQVSNATTQMSTTPASSSGVPGVSANPPTAGESPPSVVFALLSQQPRA
ncbi:uncharacterized protein LOC131210542 [Anopheles bellator]|uniref:uncharacterized protein LOC131210542 n=1 Tax=Anopheles bellator TaxID=139047 RepID=UPI002649BB5C|nr:uncharacterized protein LOC131210542 [Anopheles bellator]